MPKSLLEGFKKFRAEHYEGHNALMPRLSQQGQNPEYFIISCMDSRSLPGIIFKQPPGSFMTHTPPGAIVRSYKKGTALSAGLQVALVLNNVRTIIVLGHTGCAAISALVNKIDDPEISSFVDVAQEGLKKASELCGPQCSHAALIRHAEEQIVLQSVENLKTYPSVANLLKTGELDIKPWLFDMDTGELLAFNAVTDHFEPIQSA